MSQDRDGEGTQRKKPYEKPAMVRIGLKPEEAVLGACKTSSAAGPANKRACKSIANCSTQGS